MDTVMLLLPVWPVLMAAGTLADRGGCRIVCDPSCTEGQPLKNGLVIPLTGPAASPDVKVGPPGKAGPAGPPGPRGEKGEPGLPGEQEKPSQRRVAFYAALNEHFSGSTVLKFQDVITNWGESYDPNTGKFICKAAGTYFFTYHVLKNNAEQSTWGDLMLNGKVYASGIAQDGNAKFDTVANSAILHLAAGDEVYVQLDGGSVFKDSINRYSTFSGFLLFVD
ncbi:complement C1q-like protein 3 [Polypterus senegalus]|nr:complement C1q-like protein 3 [Polypterus senegalus]